MVYPDIVFGGMRMATFAEQVIAFNRSLRFDLPLPEGIRVMNPFLENPSALEASALFYTKYYADTGQRHMLLGINPGRYGAGLTGVTLYRPQAFAGGVRHCLLFRAAGARAVKRVRL